MVLFVFLQGSLTSIKKYALSTNETKIQIQKYKYKYQGYFNASYIYRKFKLTLIYCDFSLDLRLNPKPKAK